MSVTAPIAPSPPSYSMTTGETANITLDTTPLLLEGQSVISASCELLDMSIGRPTPVGGLPSAVISSPDVIQQVAGSLLVAGHIYRLVFTFSPVAGTVWQQILTLFVQA